MDLMPEITDDGNDHQQPASQDWIAELANEDPDYEIDSDGHWTPREKTTWTKEEMAAADAAYQRTTQGLEPCTKCQGRKTFCYKSDEYECHKCNKGKYIQSETDPNEYVLRAMKRTQMDHDVMTPERSRATKAKAKVKSQAQDPPMEQRDSSQSGAAEAESIIRLHRFVERKEYLPELEGDLARKLEDYSIVWLCWQRKLSKWHNYVQHE